MDVRRIVIEPHPGGFRACLIAQWGVGRGMRAKPLGSFFVPWESDGPEITPDSLRAIADVLEMPYELRPRWPQAPAPPDGGHGGE